MTAVADGILAVMEYGKSWLKGLHYYLKSWKLTVLNSEGQFSATANLITKLQKGDKIKVKSSGTGNSVGNECDGNPCDNFNYLEVLSLNLEPNQNINAGTMIARYGTRNSCDLYCDWEITKFLRGNGFTNSNGEITIQYSGVFLITAQLHNKHGNSGKWIRTTIKIFDGRWWYDMAQRFELFTKIMKINFIN